MTQKFGEFIFALDLIFVGKMDFMNGDVSKMSLEELTTELEELICAV
jgi:hypothetical protein